MNISERLAQHAARASYDKEDLPGSVRTMHQKADLLERDAEWPSRHSRECMQASVYLRRIAFRLWMMYGKK